MSKQRAVVLFLVVLFGIMAMGRMEQDEAPATGKVFYMTLPAPTRAIGALPAPTATPIIPPTATPTKKTCTVFGGRWIGPCEP